MNNKLNNLRNSNHAKNNKNRTVGPKVYDPEYLCGVREIINKNQEFICATIKDNNKTYSKSFSTNKHGYVNSQKMAIKWRLNMLKKFNSNNWHENDIITLYDLPKLDPFFTN
jgi:hypothetical protein